MSFDVLFTRTHNRVITYTSRINIYWTDNKYIHVCDFVHVLYMFKAVNHLRKLLTKQAIRHYKIFIANISKHKQT